MPADNKKLMLRSQLAGKSTAELEELLALDFALDKPEVDADYLSTILEVIAEREASEETDEQRTRDAWNELRHAYTQRKETELLEAGTNEKPILDHPCKTEHRKSSHRPFHILRYGAIAAVLIVLLCGTAFGWNIFKVIAEWTEETFQFLSWRQTEELPDTDALDRLRFSVANYTDTPLIPHCAPAGTQEDGNLRITERDNRVFIAMGYLADNRIFSMQLIIYDYEPQNRSYTYQKNITIEDEYEVCGITHYIMGNSETLSAIWVNGCVEGHIQGNLTLEEMQQMIDSIYSEE